MKISKEVMIDPSLLVAERTMEKTIELAVDYSKVDCGFFIPRTFLRAIKSNAITKENPLIRFYLQNAAPADIEYLQSLLVEYQKNIRIHVFGDEYFSKYEKFKAAIPEYLKWYEVSQENDLVNCLFEEWVFLQENSWIVSRSKKVFVKFKDAGAICVELGRKTLDDAIRRTLKLDEKHQALNIAKRLRAFGKWSAVGGASAASLIHPIAGALAAAASGYFLLLDP